MCFFHLKNCLLFSFSFFFKKNRLYTQSDRSIIIFILSLTPTLSNFYLLFTNTFLFVPCFIFFLPLSLSFFLTFCFSLLSVQYFSKFDITCHQVCAIIFSDNRSFLFYCFFFSVTMVAFVLLL